MTELCLTVQSDSYDLSVALAETVFVGGDPYLGDYQVDPSFKEHVLSTRNKLLTQNVTVNPIEVSRVSNPSGGTTVYIGGMTNG